MRAKPKKDPGAFSGRRVSQDERDRGFLLRRRRKGTPGIPAFRNWGSRWWHDQGEVPCCVGSAWAHWLDSSPIRQFLNPIGVYELAQFLDEWDGEEYAGTSVRAGAKVLHRLGAIVSYSWSWDSHAVAQHILQFCPVVVGTNWYEGMHYPEPDFQVSATGEILGGHAYLLDGFNSKTGLFRCKQSWGRNWGKNGRFYMSLETLQQLLDEDGEACTGIEQRIMAR